MKRFFILLSVGLMAVSCWGHSDRLKVDIDKALKHPGRAQDVYAEAVAIPLHGPEGITLGQEIGLLDVAADRFFLLDKKKNEIVIFDRNGECVTQITMADTVVDFSVYRDLVLDVLTEDAITEYSATDGAFLAKYPIQDNDVMLKRAARVTEDGFFMLGTKDGYAYDGSYLISKNHFYPAARPAPDYLSTHSFVPASECQNSRFFRCDGIVYSFGSRSGQRPGSPSPFAWAREYPGTLPGFRPSPSGFLPEPPPRRAGSPQRERDGIPPCESAPSADDFPDTPKTWVPSCSTGSCRPGRFSAGSPEQALKKLFFTSFFPGRFGETVPGGYPFSPLVAMPSIKYRCRVRNTTETGISDTMEAAMIRW